MVSRAELERRLKHQHELNHMIPDILIELVQSLQHVTYREYLQNFAGAYYDMNFETTQDEFRRVKDFEAQLVKHCSGTDIAQELDRIMKEDLAAAGAAKMLERTYRDHFAHSFQDFLSGIIVIDSFYDEISGWYSRKLNEDLKSSLECAWLLTTILHDRFRPLTKIGGYVSDRLLPSMDDESIKVGGRHMASLYRHLSAGKPLEDWVPDGSLDDPLCDILLTHGKNDNHGVRAAFSVLGYNLQIGQPTLHAVALAISLHDREPRDDLLKTGVFPVRIEQLPLVVLLSYIDAVQEWDRSSDSTDILVDIRMSGKKVTFVLDFASKKSYRNKKEELRTVAKCINNSPITLAVNRLNLRSSAMIVI